MALTPARTMPGTMELLPLDQIAFQDMLDTIRRNFECFGFLPIETPVMEFSDVLLTKQGGETERQVYFVQSTGALAAFGPGGNERPELALRFDLTVPLARYVAEHERELGFPFRRYQIQRVYRGERAQRGRFREFYQADIDVIGKDSLSLRYDAEIPVVIYSVFRDLQIGPFTIWMNNRKIMRGFFAGLGIVDGEKQMLALREVDKLDRRGVEYVRDALTGEGFGLSAESAQKILDFVQIRSHGHADAIAKLEALGQGNDTFNQGVAELRETLELIRAFGVPETHYAMNLSIARGLDYYTGSVYETTLNEHPADRLDLFGRALRESRHPITRNRNCPAWAFRSEQHVCFSSCARRICSPQRRARSRCSSRKWMKHSCRCISELAGAAAQRWHRHRGRARSRQTRPNNSNMPIVRASVSSSCWAQTRSPKALSRSRTCASRISLKLPRADLVKSLRLELEQAQAIPV